LDSRKEVGHIHYFDEDTALATLRDCGMDVLDYFYTFGGTEIPPRSKKQRLARLPRKFLYALSSHLGVRILGGAGLMVLTR
jgi:hypothetical protein